MALSQVIFDSCRGNPRLLHPLPEGDNVCCSAAEARMRLWMRRWHGVASKGPARERCLCVALSGIRLRVERRSFVCGSLFPDPQSLHESS